MKVRPLLRIFHGMSSPIVIVTAGTRGDVQPYVALGEGLREAGCPVRMVTHPDFAEMIREAGLEFASLGIPIRPFVEDEEGKDFMARAHRGDQLIRGIMKRFLQYADTVMDHLVRACSDARLIVFSSLGFPAFHIAQARGIPCVAAYLQPLTPTRAFPAPVGHIPRWLRSPLTNRMTYVFASMLSWWLVRKPSNRLRKRLGLPPLGLRGPFPLLRKLRILHLYAFSEQVVPRPPDWPDRVHITGYWFRKAPSFTPPSDLETFLSTHRPVVYVGFGSMRLPHPDRTLQMLLQALERLDAYAVMGTGWSGMEIPRDPRVYPVREIPHEWLFPRVDAVVHHGGAGTTAMGLRFGRPAVVVPFLADQFFWGERVEALGAGISLEHFRKLTFRNLADALERVLQDRFRERAEEVGARIRGENGVARAVRILLK